MWKGIEARLDQNEQSKPSPLRSALLQVIRDLELRPGHDTQYMVSFEFGDGERLLWEIQNRANSLHVKWRDLVEANGFATELRPYQSGMKDGGRHSRP